MLPLEKKKEKKKRRRRRSPRSRRLKKQLQQKEQDIMQPGFAKRELTALTDDGKQLLPHYPQQNRRVVDPDRAVDTSEPCITHARARHALPSHRTLTRTHVSR